MTETEATKELTGRVFDIQGFSVHDGPGIRITVFFKGCPLHCLWCHSPESQKYESEIAMLATKCVDCGRCLQVCPTGARQRAVIKKDDGSDKVKYSIDLEKCVKCGKCIDACLTQALYWCGNDMTVEEVMQKVRRDKPFFKKSGGGLTISGGECLTQDIDFIVELLKKCKEEDVHTAVDTCGYVPWKNIEPVIPYADLFLYDIKHMDSEMHKKGTGVPNELILENAVKIAEAGGRFHIRIPVITGFNDTMENIQATCDFLVPIKDAVDLVQILPYHKLGVVKWERLNWTNEGTSFETEPPSDETIESFCEVFRKAGIEVIVH